MSVMRSCRWHWGGCVLCLSVLLAGCGTSIDLQRSYEPPPILVPDALPDEQELFEEDTLESATTQPVEPASAQPETLPQIDPTQPDGHLVTLSSDLDAGQVVPPGHSTAWGHIDLLYDSSVRLLRWKAAWSGLSSAIIGVDFHGPATPDATAPSVMAWPGPFDARYEGRATLTTEQATDLVGGHWYVNVRTRGQPMGEIRGQLQVVE